MTRSRTLPAWVDTSVLACSCRREHAPSIIFMDEVDSIGSARTDNGGGGGDSEVQRTMLELLNQLDGFEATNKIKVGSRQCLNISAAQNIREAAEGGQCLSR